MLTNEQIADVKSLLHRGFKQSDIAAQYGVNQGRIAEIATGKVGLEVKASVEPVAAALPRYFTPQQSLSTQIEILSALVSTSPSDVARVYTISPQLAQHILTNLNHSNRRPSSEKIHEYVAAMQAKLWPVTGAALVFGKAGFLIDGQHRLLACVRSGKPLTTFIAFNIHDGAFAMMDLGRKRSNRDMFYTSGVPNSSAACSASRWLMIHESNPLSRSESYTNPQIHGYYVEKLNSPLFHEIVALAIEIERATKQLAPSGRRRNYLPVGCTAAYLLLFAQKNRKQAMAFAQQLLLGTGHGRAYIKVIRERMDANGGRLNETLRNALIVQTWNAYRADIRPSKAIFTWSMDSDFPEIH